jgi:hypothetical protein
MRIILLIAHLQFNRLAADLSMEDITLLAKLCDKYDCATVAEDRVLQWMTRLYGPYTVPLALSWIWIGWTFRQMEWFSKGVTFLLDNVAPKTLKDMSGLLIGFPGMCLPFKVEFSIICPNIAAEYLCESFKERFTPVIGHLRAPLQLFESSRLKFHMTEKDKTMQKRCEFICIGALATLYRGLGLEISTFRLPQPDQAPFSMRLVRPIIQRLNSTFNSEFCGVSGLHLHCRLPFKLILEAAGGNDGTLFKAVVMSDELAAHFCDKDGTKKEEEKDANTTTMTTETITAGNESLSESSGGTSDSISSTTSSVTLSVASNVTSGETSNTTSSATPNAT